MEINGLVNMQILLDEYAGKHLVQAEFVNKMREQLDLLERYLLAHDKWNREQLTAFVEGRPPYWHEVRANPKDFPTNKELSDEYRKA